MKYIMLKTLRDIRDTIGSFISIIVVIIVGCFFFAGITSGSNAVTKQVRDYYASSNYATARAEYMYVNSAAVEEIAAEKGVQKAVGYSSFYTQTAVGKNKVDLSISTLTTGVDDPYIVSGNMPTAKNEMLIDSVSADTFGISVGDTLSFDIATLEKITLSMRDLPGGGQTPQYEQSHKSVKYEFRVCGIYHSPDVIYKVNMRNTAAMPDEFITAHVLEGSIELYTEDAKVVGLMGKLEIPVLSYADIPTNITVYNGIKIIGDEGLDVDELFGRYSLASEADIRKLFEDLSAPAGLYMYGLERKNFPAVVAFDGINNTIAALAGVLPFIFFAVAAAITVISMTKTVDNQRMQIGVIQALGITKSRVYFSYIFYALFACLIGGAVGGVVGVLAVPRLVNYLYAMQFAMPPTPQHASWLFMILGIVVAAALACLAAFISCHRTLKVRPAQAMRPKPPKKTRRILAERWKWLWSRLGFGAKMNLRNMFLNKLRMLLSSVGIIGCLALLIALIGLKDNMDFSFKQYDATCNYDLTVVTAVAVDLEKFDFDELTEHDGAEYMETLTFAPDFSGRFEYNGKIADMTVMAIPTAADAERYKYADADSIRLYTDKNGKKRLEFNDDTFAIPTALADELGVGIGDTVRITGYSLDNRAIECEAKITDIVYEYFEQKVYCPYSFFRENGVGLYATASYATLKQGADIQNAIDTLKGYDEIRGVRAFTQSYADLKDRMALLDYAVVLFVVGAAVLAIAVIYNITATNLKDRTREIATLMVLGYKPRETANMLIVENMVITGLGCIVGLPIGYALMLWLVQLASSFNVFISSFLSWYVAIGCIILTFAFSLVASLMFNTRIKKISMVESLKSVE